jgi:hypothetical protein
MAEVERYLRKAPLSGTVTLDGTTYHWQFVDRATGQLFYSINSDQMKAEQITIDVTAPAFQEYLKKESLKAAREQSVFEITDEEEALAQKLIRDPKLLMAFYRSTFDAYHYGEWGLKTTLFRGIHRIAFHSNSALLHFDLTGKSRGGKSGFINRWLCFYPESRKEALTSVSPKALYYRTLVERKEPTGSYDANGNPKFKTVEESDPNYYVGKIIALLEFTDMSEFKIMKPFADEYEYSAAVHATIIDQKSVDLTVNGARSVITVSVAGVQNDEGKQLLNRFIQTPIERSSEGSTTKMLELTRLNDLYERDISTDRRTHIIQRSLEILYEDGDKVVVIPPSKRIIALIGAIETALHKDGFNTTQIRQFRSLCLCGAFEKRFARSDDQGVMQIKEEDVLEAWYLMAEFGAFTKSNLTRNDLAVLEAINEGEVSQILQDGEEYSSFPTAGDIREQTGLSAGTINNMLRVKEGARGVGKFLEYGYVDYTMNQKRGASVFWLTDEGKRAVTAVTRDVKIHFEKDGIEESFKPINPCAYPYENTLKENSLNSTEFISKMNFENDEDWPDSKNKDSEGFQKIEFNNSFNYNNIESVKGESSAIPPNESNEMNFEFKKTETSKSDSFDKQEAPKAPTEFKSKMNSNEFSEKRDSAGLPDQATIAVKVREMLEKFKAEKRKAGNLSLLKSGVVMELCKEFALQDRAYIEKSVEKLSLDDRAIQSLFTDLTNPAGGEGI